MSEEFLKKILWTFPEQDVIKTIFNFYEDLQQKVEQLEKELNTTNDLLHKANDEVVSYCNRCIELENIRKEAIEYNYKLQENYSHGALFEDKIAVNVYKVAEENLNILNKGSEDK